MTQPTNVSRPRLDWLSREVEQWRRAGIVDAGQASAILTHYRADARHGVRLSLGRLLLWLGGAFVGIGVIWLVAANLDELAPVTRFLVVVGIWLSLLAGGEALAGRAQSRALVGAVRLMAALAFGGVVFQAAQSLQVPAYEPVLVGVWGLGALVHAYAVRADAPLVVGVAAGTVWWVWQPLWDHGSVASAVVAFGAASVLGFGLAALHDGRLDRFASIWRFVGALLGLVGLFIAAVPYSTTEGFEWSPWLLVALSVAAVALVASLGLARGLGRLEPLGAALVLGLSILLVLWDTGTDTSQIDAEDWGHAAVSVAVYVLVAVALAALGTVRRAPALTFLAMVALVVFATFQSFAVFAAIVTGAWLFVVLGSVFLGTGFLFDRARRGLADVLDDPATEGTLP